MPFSSVKGCSGIAVLCCLLAAVSSQAQPRPQPTLAQPPARYETVLNRLEAVTSAPLSRWRYHPADTPHPEDPSLDDSSWTPITFGAAQGNQPAAGDAPGWYRTRVEVPATAGGK